MFRVFFLSQLFVCLILIVPESACAPLPQPFESQEATHMPSAKTPESREVPIMSEKVIAEVVLCRKDGVSILNAEEGITAETVAKYRVEEEVINAASKELKKLGFEVVQTTPFGMTISSDKALFEKVFQTTLEVQHKQEPSIGVAHVYYRAVQPIQIPANLSSLIPAVTLPTPPEYYP
jgi:hypothetical protein